MKLSSLLSKIRLCWLQDSNTIFSDIVIAAFDATTSNAIAKKYDITGYPTIKFFEKGSTTPTNYDGGRTADTIVS